MGRETTWSAETLAGASAKTVENLLSKTNEVLGTRGNFSESAQVPRSHFPPRQTIATGICGAPALADRDEEKPGQPQNSRTKVCPIVTLGNAELTASTEDSDWEEITGNTAAVEHPGSSLTRHQNSAAVSDGVLTISLSKEGAVHQPSKRTTFTKADREFACLIHRCHLLCLLGRSLLLDQASGHPLLQALMLSLLPLDVAAHLRPQATQQLSALAQVLEWFRGQFRVVDLQGCLSATQVSSAGKTGEVHSEDGWADDVEAAMRCAKGVDGIMDRLKQVVGLQRGRAEEVVALFVALVRAQGFAARTIHSLQPMPLKPADALRHQEMSAHALAARSSRTTHKYISSGGLLSGAKRSKPSAGISGVQGQLNAPPGQGGEGAEEGHLLEGANTGGERGRGKGRARGGRRQSRGQRQTSGAAGAEGQIGQGRQRKRKCDEEEEQQLALAMAATAFEAGMVMTDAGASGDKGSSATPAGAELWKRQRSGGAGQSVAYGQGATPQKAVVMGGAVPGAGSCWAEVFLGPFDTGRWVPVDPLTGWIDRAADMEVLTPGGQPLTYVVALAGGGAKEVIQRYSSSFLAVEKLRDSEWWEATLRPLRSQEVAASIAAAAAQHLQGQAEVGPRALPPPRVESRGAGSGVGVQPPPSRSLPQPDAPRGWGAGAMQSSAAARAHKLLAAREDAELAQRAQLAQRSLPTTIDGFKSHPLYVLQRHISRYQDLAPGAKACGLHRGEAYFLREDVCELHTAERWRREGRQVVEAELPHPAKRIKKRKLKGAGGQGQAGGEEQDGQMAEVSLWGGQAADDPPMSSLYGFWQTVPWTPPAASGGKVPRNERGNVEVPPFAAALPAGTVHLSLPSIARVCRKLQVDYAQGLAGFEVRGGMMVPVLEGVVICSEFETLVVSTYLEEERQREERARAKRYEVAEVGWRMLLRAMLARVRLQESYGPEGAVGRMGHRRWAAGEQDQGLVGGEGGTMAEAASKLLRANQVQRTRAGAVGMTSERGLAPAASAHVPADDLTVDSSRGQGYEHAQRLGKKKGRRSVAAVLARTQDEGAVRREAGVAEELETEEI